MTEYFPGRRPSNPWPTDHLWRAAMPGNLSAGEYVIEVEATDMYGVKFVAKHPFKVISKP